MKGERLMKPFYHGTTDVFPIQKVLLPPAITEIKREEWRKNYVDKAFLTDSLPSANMYAKKACKKYGGNPVVYIIKPIGQFFKTVNTEYIADKALVVRKLIKSGA